MKIIFLICLFATAGTALSGEKLTNQKLDQLKMRIDFGAAVKGEHGNPIANVVSPSMLNAPGIDSTWGIVSQARRAEKKGELFKWTMRRQDEHLVVEIFLSTAGSAPAHEYFFYLTCENNMRESPFNWSSPQIGTLSVSHFVPKSSQLVWLYRNVAISVRSDDSSLDVTKIAEWLQMLLELNAAYETAIKYGYLATWTSADLKAGKWHIFGSSKSDNPPMYFVVDGTNDKIVYKNENSSIETVPAIYVSIPSSHSFELMRNAVPISWQKR